MLETTGWWFVVQWECLDGLIPYTLSFNRKFRFKVEVECKCLLRQLGGGGRSEG